MSGDEGENALWAAWELAEAQVWTTSIFAAVLAAMLIGTVGVTVVGVSPRSRKRQVH